MRVLQARPPGWGWSAICHDPCVHKSLRKGGDVVREAGRSKSQHITVWETPRVVSSLVSESWAPHALHRPRHGCAASFVTWDTSRSLKLPCQPYVLVGVPVLQAGTFCCQSQVTNRPGWHPRFPQWHSVTPKWVLLSLRVLTTYRPPPQWRRHGTPAAGAYRSTG